MRQKPTVVPERPKIVRREATVESPEVVEESHFEEVPTPASRPSPRRSWKVTLTLLALKTAAVGGLCYAVGRGVEVAITEAAGRVEEAKAAVLERMTVTKLVKEVKEVDDATLEEIIQKVAKEEGIDPIVLQVIANKESSDGRKQYRFESGLYSRLRSDSRYSKLSDDEVRMLASSHGAFHVLGLTAKSECDLPWHRLYEPLTSARCAASIVSRLSKEHAEKRSGERLWNVFKAYNGKGPAAESYADHAMRLVAERLYERVAG